MTVTQQEFASGKTTMLSVSIPMKLPRLSNDRMHWRVLSQIKKSQKLTVAAAMSGKSLPALPVRVLLTRVGRKWDSDNNVAGLKYVRDEVARAYSADDGSYLFDWQYSQVKPHRGGVARVDIRIESIETSLSKPGMVLMEI